MKFKLPKSNWEPPQELIDRWGKIIDEEIVKMLHDEIDKKLNMGRRIVIIPTFAEAPMIKCQIPNIVKALQPDIVIYNEGVFPHGPESSSDISEGFRKKYCSDDGHTGFDFEDTKMIIAQASVDYPDIEWHLGTIEYPHGMSADDAYSYAVSNFSTYGIEIQEGDILLPSEADAFNMESDADKIDDLLNVMKPGEAISTVWWDFGSTQHYIEQRMHPDVNTVTKSRRFAICYKSMEHYFAVIKNFTSQNYTTTTTLVDLKTYHYPWFRTGKYLQLRCDILNRPPGYWEDYLKGHYKAIEESVNRTFEPSIMIRPTNTNNYRFIKYIDTEHPDAIKEHECWIKNMIVGEDMICPVTDEHCDDECCPVGSWCNLADMSNPNIVDINI